MRDISRRSLTAGIVLLVVGGIAYRYLPNAVVGIGRALGAGAEVGTELLLLAVDFIRLVAVPLGVGLITACIVIEGVTRRPPPPELPPSPPELPPEVRPSFRPPPSPHELPSEDRPEPGELD
jgi:hypothetical protein